MATSQEKDPKKLISKRYVDLTNNQKEIVHSYIGKYDTLSASEQKTIDKHNKDNGQVIVDFFVNAIKNLPNEYDLNEKAKLEATFGGHPDLSQTFRFANLLLTCPNVYLKVLLTYAFWILINDVRITPNIKTQFQPLEQAAFQQEKEQVKSKHLKFDENARSSPNISKTIYNNLILSIKNIDDAKATFNSLLRLITRCYGDDLSNSIRDACENSVRYCTTATILSKLKVLADLVPDPRMKEQINVALRNMIQKLEGSSVNL